MDLNCEGSYSLLSSETEAFLYACYGCHIDLTTFREKTRNLCITPSMHAYAYAIVGNFPAKYLYQGTEIEIC